VLSESNCLISLPRAAPIACRHRDFALAHAGPRQQQIREIRAGDQQHQPGRRQQNPEGIFIFPP
jgi:hypothetical protein